MVIILADFDVIYWSCCPQTPQSKVENDKYTETDTWHPERVEECSYYRLCERISDNHLVRTQRPI